MAKAKTKYVVKQAFRIIEPVLSGKGKRATIKRVIHKHEFTRGTYYDLSKDVIESKSFKRLVKRGLIDIYEEKSLTDNYQKVEEKEEPKENRFKKDKKQEKVESYESEEKEEKQ